MCTKDRLIPMALKYDLAYKLENKEDLRTTQENHLTLYSEDEMEAMGVHTIYHGVWTPTLHNIEIMDWFCICIFRISFKLEFQRRKLRFGESHKKYFDLI